MIPMIVRASWLRDQGIKCMDDNAAKYNELAEDLVLIGRTLDEIQNADPQEAYHRAMELKGKLGGRRL